MASNVDSELPTPATVARAINGMIARVPIVAALSPFAITPDAARSASDNDKAALAALVAALSFDIKGTPESRAVQAARDIVRACISRDLVGPEPVDDSPEALEASIIALWTAVNQWPDGYYPGTGNLDSSSGRVDRRLLLSNYVKNTGLSYLEVLSV
jgi:hypothetical protein